MRKIAGILLILLGIILITFPKVQELYYEKQQQEILNSWQESMVTIENMDTYDIEEITLPDVEDAKEELRAKYIQENTEGILKIDKIKLYQPILRGVTEKNLNISLASIKDTGQPGAIGNYCVAGHRSRTYGRNFNRLGELVTGDIIEMIAQEETYQYQVSEVLLVKAEETWVLKGDNTQKLITLVTCDYSQKPSLRLIITGKLID